jgi:hypothetical protein
MIFGYDEGIRRAIEERGLEKGMLDEGYLTGRETNRQEWNGKASEDESLTAHRLNNLVGHPLSLHPCCRLALLRDPRLAPPFLPPQVPPSVANSPSTCSMRSLRSHRRQPSSSPVHVSEVPRRRRTRGLAGRNSYKVGVRRTYRVRR